MKIIIIKFVLIIYLIVNLLVCFLKQNIYRLLIMLVGGISIVILLSIELILFLKDCESIFLMLYIPYNLGIYNTYIRLEYDQLSLILIDLTFLLYVITVCLIWHETYYTKFLQNLINFLYGSVVMVFSTYDLLIFFISFELVLIPMYFIIFFWGPRDRKISALYKLLFYTLAGSVSFLTVIVYSYTTFHTLNLNELLLYGIASIDPKIQKILWFLMFVTFAVKTPLFPFHIWLPEAHAEAPTVGSVILAGILLKFGPYGLIRFANLLFPLGMMQNKMFVMSICLIGIIYTSIIALRQIDIKKLIAYSSIGHMSLAISGILSNNFEGNLGALILLVAHGYVSAGLFVIIGYIYDRYGSRNIRYIKGILQLYPKFGFFIFLYLLGNLAFPLTINFFAELKVFLGIIQVNLFIGLLSLISTFFVVAYNLYFVKNVLFGKVESEIRMYKNDLDARESTILFILISPVFYLGIHDQILVTYTLHTIIWYLYNVLYNRLFFF